MIVLNECQSLQIREPGFVGSDANSLAEDTICNLEEAGKSIVGLEISASGNEFLTGSEVEGNCLEPVPIGIFKLGTLQLAKASFEFSLRSEGLQKSDYGSDSVLLRQLLASGSVGSFAAETLIHCYSARAAKVAGGSGQSCRLNQHQIEVRSWPAAFYRLLIDTGDSC